MSRRGSPPERKLAPFGSLTTEALDELAGRLRYAGMATHKLHPGDYGFVPPVNPRPSKSACDDLRGILLAEAATLFRKGLLTGMVSQPGEGGVPKNVWAVDADSEVYEAKTKPPDTVYHGYRLGEDEREMRRYIREEWGRRCPKG